MQSREPAGMLPYLSRLRHRLSETRCGGALAALLAVFGTVSCLPADNRPPPGSILLLVSSADEPTTPTVDGWTIIIDRLILSIGNASLGFNCTSYSDAHYLRLLDGRLTTDQKLVLLYGLGRCYLDFYVAWPATDTVLGEGVSEDDLERMLWTDGTVPGQRQQGITVDFAATAWRGADTKHMHWEFTQGRNYNSCMYAMADGSSESLELQSNENSTFHLGIRGAALFGDNASPTNSVLRFDPFAAADSVFGNADGEITLDELGGVDLDYAKQFGHYLTGKDLRGMPRTLKDYLHLVLLPWLVSFREDISCAASVGTGHGR